MAAVRNRKYETQHALCLLPWRFLLILEVNRKNVVKSQWLL